MKIEERIKILRKRQGLTRQKLANLTDSSLSYITKLERGDIKSPSITKLSKIAKVLHITIDDLIQTKTFKTTQHDKNIKPITLSDMSKATAIIKAN